MSDSNFGVFFEQEPPVIPVTGLIAALDLSPSYALMAAAVFKSQTGFLVVFVSGCSCWPDRGTTEQIPCHRIVEVDRELTGIWSPLRDKCQAVKWMPQTEAMP